jgi:hypothetical protein
MREISGKLSEIELLPKNQKKAMPFVSEIKAEYEKFGSAAFCNGSPIDQLQILEPFKDYICQALGLNSLEMVEIREKGDLAEHIVDKCGPMRPLIVFES